MIRNAEPADLTAILDIYNDAVIHSAATYDYEAYTPAKMADWYWGKVNSGYAVLVSEENGLITGFAAYGQFRTKPAYKYTVENSVYVHKDHRGRHIGTALMKELIGLANEKGFAVMVAGIDSESRASLVLHEKLGFTYCGIIKKAGYKFGRWLDVVFYQLELEGPARPNDS